MTSGSDTSKLDPFLLSVLKSRLEAIVREMTLVVLKASRSAVIKNARDFSCALLTYDCRLVSIEDALAIHVMSMETAISHIVELFDDIEEGDLFLNNCPYTGGTHHADLILAQPVFVDGRPLFWAVALSHHADIGAPVASTYLPYAKTIYEEGMHFPCVRIGRNHKPHQDILRMGLYKIRASDIWLGDLRAQIGACRTAETRLRDVVGRYGREVIADFVEEWFAYGERRAIAEIRKLPAGTFEYETRHDPVPGVADDGIPVRVKMTVLPDEGRIVIDLRDNIDNVPGGLNLSENTCRGASRIGVFNNLDASVPHNHGSLSRVEVLMREGSVVGRPKYPVGTSVATTNVNDRLIMAANCVFAEMGEPYGQAEGGPHLPVGIAVISGADPFKEGRTYVNQVFIGYAGGGALHGHDGWLTYCGAANGGMIFLDSVEVDESMYPIIIESRGVAPDSQGFGQFEGAPGVSGVFYPVDHTMTVIYAADATTNPAKGVLSGAAARPVRSEKQLPGGERVTLPAFNEELCRAGEKMVFQTSGGGGYGDPSRRNPARVLASINRRWLSPEMAERAYGLSVTLDAATGDYVLAER
ncbi:N-methylhydantoinase B [Rhodoligotrophos appendicifer]|uniref:hydantoinase B/oxoprolinase family protein n=1 Tax=Rhodoligotrophos appendicifer TaxID=987056 RepID=UPI001184A55D|nr:hydantoinase B/oxoprolinase family protein [Rhodoligotrophos appendicifer]